MSNLTNPLILPFTAFPIVDSFTIASIPMPGKWTLLDAKKKFGWQIQAGYMLSGAFVLPKGDELVVAKFRGEFWDFKDYALYDQIRKTIFAKGLITLGLVAAALGIDHPELKSLGVASVVVLEMGPVLQSEGGLWTVLVDFLQYRPPLPAPKKPAFVVPDIAPPVPTAKGAQEIEIQKLTAQAAALTAK